MAKKAKKAKVEVVQGEIFGPFGPDIFEGMKGFTNKMREESKAAQTRANEQAHVNLALNVLGLSAQSETLLHRFDAEGLLDQAVGIVKVGLKLGPLADKLKVLPEETEGG